MFKRLSLPYLLLIVALLSACATAPQASAPAAASGSPGSDASEDADVGETMRGILRLSHPLFMEGNESLDPSSQVEFIHANLMLYNRLVRLDENGTPAPELATSWMANEEATEWTFTLRDDVIFHDGTLLTSADVAYTFAHILRPEAESPAASLLSLIAGTETPDPQTVVFQLSEGHADFALLLASRLAAIIPAESGDTIGETGIGTGPFKLESLDAEGTTILVANDDYWKGTPGLASVELSGIADADARALAAQSGQLDLVLNVTAMQADLFANNPDFTVLEFPSGQWATLVMRTDIPPFDDVRVRQAVRMAADRQAIVDLVLTGAGTVSCDTPVAPTDVYRREDTCPQDIEGAKALLTEAGYADGLDVTLYATAFDASMIPLAEVYQQQAAAAGINVTLEIAPIDSYWTEVWMVEPFITSAWLERPADEALDTIWRSTSPWNESFFQNPAFDQLLDDARNTLGFEARRDLYLEAQRLLAEEGGHLIPYHLNQFHIASSKLSGVPARSLQHIEWHLISKSE